MDDAALATLEQLRHLTPEQLAALPTAERREVALLVDALTRRLGSAYNRYFPTAGPYRRALYPRSLMFWSAGTLDRERLFLAANRTSKTVSAAFETTAHLTGIYKDWWPGRRFEGPIEAWAAGDTLETTRDIIQNELMGPRDLVRVKRYAGMIPGNLVLDRTLKSGSVSDCVDTVWVRHVERHHGAPCTSMLQFKAFNQGRLSFQGTSKHLIWLDEEPPDAGDESSGGGTPAGNGDIVTECLLRTATTDGMLMYTLTPLRGLTPFLDQCLERGRMVRDEDGVIVNAKLGIFGKAA